MCLVSHPTLIPIFNCIIFLTSIVDPIPFKGVIPQEWEDKSEEFHLHPCRLYTIFFSNLHIRTVSVWLNEKPGVHKTSVEQILSVIIFSSKL